MVAQIIDGVIIGAGAAILIALLAALGLSVDTTGGAVAFFATALARRGSRSRSSRSSTRR